MSEDPGGKLRDSEGKERERLLRDVVESLESRGAANIHGEVPGTGSLLGGIFLQFGVGSGITIF